MVFCTNCGSQIEDGIRFCTNCGQPVNEPVNNAAPEEASETQGNVVEAEVMNSDNQVTETVQAVEVSAEEVPAAEAANQQTSEAEKPELAAQEPAINENAPATEPVSAYSQPGTNPNPQGQPIYGQNPPPGFGYNPQQGRPPYGQNGQPIYGQNPQGQPPYGYNPQQGRPPYGQNGQPIYGQNPQGQPQYQYNQGQPYGQPPMGQYPRPAVMPQNGYDAKPTPGSIYAPVGTGTFMGFMLLFMIPVIGWIIALIVACGGSKRVNLRNFAKAYLFWLLIGIVVSIVFTILALTVFESLFTELDLYEWINDLERIMR